ncbi:peptidoglycan-binding protein [Calothrix sp. PCC 7507]|uniref:peptidoglycan-binding protein n=1 Tax=Calothrix sp. PCC 7507 TaxID=99598 RepID=UPI00029F3867|nr:peptidoglycan-binding protein [Calothrix sp. PCC 7507]AFY35252.1 Peptidoglycan-binding domain 1 protein [Calothrix sp. PCC 7507]
MRLCYSSIPILTCCICLGLYHSPANPAIPNRNPKILQLVQTISTSVPQPPIQDIQTLQTQLKKLGYYNGAVNGQYSKSTQIAVSQFQKAKGLVADGIAGKETKESLQAATDAKIPLIPSPSPASKPTSQAKASQGGFIWWSLLGLGLLGSIGIILYLMRRFGRVKQVQQPQTSDAKTETAANQDSEMSSSKLDTTINPVENIPSDSQQPMTASISTKLLPAGQTSRLAKLNIVDELIKDLHSHDPSQRRKAIWDLGQQGDSRAIQPLLDLMMDVDSQQRSLILAAVGEIGTRTLKPMNRALAISMQDESPQVRQNAIRDLTRVYDMMTQISQILCHALEDPDTEVQATARYALNQMNRIRTVPEQKNLAEE